MKRLRLVSPVRRFLDLGWARRHGSRLADLREGCTEDNADPTPPKEICPCRWETHFMNNYT